jgi:ATP-dependent helicase/nuclease subunit B
MGGANAIRVVPFSRNLLACVAEDLVARHYSADDPLRLARVAVVVPHRRGTVYLRHYLQELLGPRGRKPLLLPRLVTIEDLASDLAVVAEDKPGRALATTDQAWLLFGLAKRLGIYRDVAGSWDRFFGWGVRLAAIIDEIDREMIDPQDIIYPEDVPPEARALLERLKEVCEGFTAALEEQGFTTPAKRFRRVVEALAADEPNGELARLVGGPVYLVGFYATGRAEDRLFRYLFDRGAFIYWHADPDNLPTLYQRWRDTWKVPLEAVGERAGVTDSGGQAGPKIHFHEAYDLHAELKAVQAVLASEVSLPDEGALVLPDPSALVPTLYHIPETTPVNVSLGYPLERSSLAALIEQLMTVQEGRNGDRAYYYQDYLALVRHPYVRRLPTPGGKDGRIVLHLLEDKIRQYGRPFLAQADTRELLVISFAEEGDRRLLAAEGIDLEEAVQHVDRIHAELLRPWQDVKTPGDLAATLRQTVRFLLLPFLDRLQPATDQSLDGEFAYALERQVIPGLEDALFADQPMAQSLVFALLKDLIHMTRVPFEGQPLKGLQILGLLETRLLSFDRVVVIDVNEGTVPAHEEVNPLLPEPLRPAVGLPPKEKEEAITRYHFQRLVESAREVHLVWQSATTPSASGLEGKKTRSRFVEALLWREEARAGRLLTDVIRREALAIPPQALVKEQALAKSEADAARVAKFIKAHAGATGISATLANTYLRCPTQFLYKYVLGLDLPESPLEDIDSAELGILIHRALEAYFKPYEGRDYVRARDNDAGKLEATFAGLCGESQMYRALGPEKRFFLESAVNHRLRSYLRSLPETTRIEGLEQRHKASIATSLGDLGLTGKVDRIDLRDGRLVILDYKTGKVGTATDKHIEEVLSGFALPAAFDYAGLAQVREAVGDLQLPLYVMLVAASTARSPVEILSAYVEIRAAGDDSQRYKERYFVKPEKIAGLGDAYAAWFSDTFPAVLAYVIDHMVKAPLFYRATDEADCTRCDYSSICRVAFA